MTYPNIEAERARSGKTKQQLAKEIAVNPKTLQNWQHGKCPIPCDKLLSLCEIFGCTSDYLLGRSKERNPPVDFSA